MANSAKVDKVTDDLSKEARDELTFLRVDSLSIFFDHRSFIKPDPFSLGFKGGFCTKEDPWKEREGTPRIL